MPVLLLGACHTGTIKGPLPHGNGYGNGGLIYSVASVDPLVCSTPVYPCRNPGMIGVWLYAKGYPTIQVYYPESHIKYILLRSINTRYVILRVCMVFGGGKKEK